MSDPSLRARRGRRPVEAGPKGLARPRRGRDALLVAGATALAVAIAVPFVDAEPPRPGMRPHVEAKVGCKACHDAPNTDGDPKRACVGCHGRHGSTRAGHRAAEIRGALTCVHCHPPHEPTRGLTLHADGGATAWTTGEPLPLAYLGPTAHVPLVASEACARCHDLQRASDPIASCLGADRSVSLCFDEHARGEDTRAPAPGACAAEHTTARFVAWEAARELAGRVPPAPEDDGSARAPWWLLGAGGIGAAGAVMALARARRRPPPRARGNTVAPATRVRLPQIDTTTCLGCYACVDACPFEVLEIQRYVAVVARPADCCGAIACEEVCPNGSLRITEGEPIEERPRVDAFLESLDAPGVFLAGDLTGLPLIKNAMAQGVRVIDRIADTLPPRTRQDVLDVVIVGAGPAGLSAALRAKDRGLSYAVVEQATMAASIRAFPRNKIVHDPPLNLPVEGALWLREATKEELLAQWTRVVRTHGIVVHEGLRVARFEREEGAIVAVASGPDGERAFRGRRVVLAIGRRGTPRRLDCAVALGAEGKVSYAVADARSFAGQRVLIVGLGDSAMEAACAIARQPGAEVTISYRGSGFVRGKARNIAEVKALMARGRVRVVFESLVTEVDAEGVRLRTPSGTEHLPVDAVVAQLGGIPAWDVVRAAGVRLAASGPASNEDL